MKIDSTQDWNALLGGGHVPGTPSDVSTRRGLQDSGTKGKRLSESTFVASRLIGRGGVASPFCVGTPPNSPGLEGLGWPSSCLNRFRRAFRYNISFPVCATTDTRYVVLYAIPAYWALYCTLDSAYGSKGRREKVVGKG